MSAKTTLTKRWRIAFTRSLETVRIPPIRTNESQDTHTKDVMTKMLTTLDINRKSILTFVKQLSAITPKKALDVAFDQFNEGIERRLQK